MSEFAKFLVEFSLALTLVALATYHGSGVIEGAAHRDLRVFSKSLVLFGGDALLIYCVLRTL